MRTVIFPYIRLHYIARYLMSIMLMACMPNALYAATFTVTSNLDAVGDCTTPGSGTCTLRQAIINANASVGVDDLIVFNLPAGSTTITLLSPLDPITDTVTIDGANISGAGAITLESNNLLATAFQIDAGGSGSSIQNFAAISNFTGIANGTIFINAVTDVTISGNGLIEASGVGGRAINVFNSTATISGNGLIETSGVSQGRAINVENSTATITGNTTISALGANSRAINVDNSTATITGNTSIIASGIEGTAIRVANGATATITGNITIASTGVEGRAIAVVSTSIATIITGNTTIEASGSGGRAIDLESSTATITGNNIISASGTDGIAIYVLESTATVTDNARIAGTAAGVVVDTDSVARILTNSIDNPLGIDLRDTFDRTIGNNNQPAPVIERSVICRTANTIFVGGFLPAGTTLPDTDYTIQLFTNGSEPAQDQGLTFIGEFIIHTPVPINVTPFNNLVTLVGPVDPTINYITATATPTAVSATNGTSEFSIPTLATTDNLTLTLAANPAAVCTDVGTEVELTATATNAAAGAVTYELFVEGNPAVIDSITNDTGTAVFTVTPTETSTFLVNATDQQGCPASATVTVPVGELPVVSVSPTPATVCAGGSVTLTATSATATSFSWVGPNNRTSNTNTITITNATAADAGIYTVTATDANGCTRSASTTLTVNAKPAIAVAITPSTIAAGQSATLSANVTTETTAPYTIRFATGNTVNADGSNVFATQVINGTSASVTVAPTTTTQFSADVTDANGCTSDPAAPVTLTVIGGASLIASPSSICEGQTVTLTATLATSGIAPFTFVFSDGFTVTTNDRSVTHVVTPLFSTTFTVTITDSTGAQFTATTAVAVINQQRSLLSKALLAKYCVASDFV